ncbi:NUDIX domain-containing protein [Patescibacteria group bacterium]|nr:NUDIX domain-containing protein [Patescibacteria group bacterium]MBU1448987.1 NUDIX domain-containing protein [Patescibacteria group bacterium]MBU2613461.1 NUDIX domain-containing protein [Patescibacteria group bacterium]
MNQTQPLVGVGVMILKGDTVLLAKRRGSHGEGEYAFPGGHLEHLESFEACARRETTEECGIEIGNVRFQVVANIVGYAPKHYVHIGLVADWVSGEPEVLEPEKSEFWRWYPLDAPPDPLFEPYRIAVQAYRDGISYYDTEPTTSHEIRQARPGPDSGHHPIERGDTRHAYRGRRGIRSTAEGETS